MQKATAKRVRVAARLHHFVNLIVLSILTGLFSGVVVTFYNILTSIGEDASSSLYALVRDNPAFVPLLFAGLIAGAFVIGAFLKLVPMIRGSGVPQAEGAARGKLRFKWYTVMCSMFAASLACVFMGLPAGSEGPSLEIGGCAGDGVGAMLRRTRAARRLQIAAGSSAGLATAFNAPVTGLIFAMEEAFRSFSAQVFSCSAVSVIVALTARNLIRAGLGFSTGFSLTSYTFSSPDAMGYLWIFLAALAAALSGVAFYHVMLLFRRLFGKMTFFKGLGKYLVPFLAAGDVVTFEARAESEEELSSYLEELTSLPARYSGRTE